MKGSYVSGVIDRDKALAAVSPRLRSEVRDLKFPAIITFNHQGDFTVVSGMASGLGHDNVIPVVGVSKRCKDDRPNRERGREVAINRLYVNLDHA